MAEPALANDFGKSLNDAQRLAATWGDARERGIDAGPLLSLIHI